ncbi:APC family permease [Phenylobacterium montanum]|uniref:APC family permease n=1 Tax=Phenylobacterium montanum TaxID=2823693 RepID=A0A975G0N9_9CAUL|nr:APC family permease [Caulobacter sp. S6]QUD88387.1 APC family permease [Caulobacter sp. S6]
MTDQAGVSAPAAGHGKLHRQLSPFGVLLLTLSCLSPVFSVYGIGSDVLQHTGTGALGLFALGLACAFIWSAVYAELGSAYPYAGGDYVGVGSILGSWAGVATLAIWAATAGPAVAFQVQIISTYTRELVPGLPPSAVTFGSLALCVAVALMAVRTGALITGLFLAIEILAVLALILIGFAHPARGLAALAAHPVAIGSHGIMEPVALGVLALGAISAVYGTVGGNQAIGFGEELRDPHRNMGNVIVVACLIGAFGTALPVIAVLFGARDLTAVLRDPAPMAAFVNQAAGPWAGRALSAGVALAIFNATIAQIMFGARLYFSLGRDGIFPGPVNRLLAGVHEQSGAPRGATMVVAVFSLLCCFLSSHTLLIFNTGLLVYGWSLVCLSVLVGRRRGMTARPGYWRAPLGPLAPLLGLVMAGGFTLADLADHDAGRPSLILLGGVVLAAVAWSHFALRRRPGGWAPVLAE